MHTENIVGLIVFLSFCIQYRLILCIYTLDAMNSNKMIFTVTAIALQFLILKLT